MVAAASIEGAHTKAGIDGHSRHHVRQTVAQAPQATPEGIRMNWTDWRMWLIAAIAVALYVFAAMVAGHIVKRAARRFIDIDEDEWLSEQERLAFDERINAKRREIDERRRAAVDAWERN